MVTTANTLYDVLELAPSASPARISAAFKSLSKQYHPDRDGGDAELFKAITKAYTILHDPTQRADYDRELRLAREQADRATGEAAAAAAAAQQSAGAGAPAGSEPGWGTEAVVQPASAPVEPTYRGRPEPARPADREPFARKYWALPLGSLIVIFLLMVTAFALHFFAAFCLFLLLSAGAASLVRKTGLGLLLASASTAAWFSFHPTGIAANWVVGVGIVLGFIAAISPYVLYDGRKKQTP